MFVSRRASLVPCVVCAIVLASVVGSFTVWNARSDGGRLLTSAELAGTFGDSAACVQEFTCFMAFSSGASDCCYCSSSSVRTVCCGCPDSSSKTCDYTGPAGQCHAGPRLCGPIDGDPGSCGTCTSSTYNVDGDCCITGAGGDDCPCTGS